MSRVPATQMDATLPAVDLASPSSMLSLPDWLRRRLVAVSAHGKGTILRDDQGRRIGERPTLTASMMLNGSMRRSLALRIDQLQAALMPGPVEDIADTVGSLIAGYANGRTDAATVAVKADAYLDVLDDLPAWAVREAVRRWRRGECDAEMRDYDFLPSTARLRQIADRIAKWAPGQIIALQRLLDAEVEPAPMTDAERAAVLEEVGARMKAAAEAVDAHAVTTCPGFSPADRAEAERILSERKAAAVAEIAAAENSAI